MHQRQRTLAEFVAQLKLSALHVTSVLQTCIPPQNRKLPRVTGSNQPDKCLSEIIIHELKIVCVVEWCRNSKLLSTCCNSKFLAEKAKKLERTEHGRAHRKRFCSNNFRERLVLCMVTEYYMNSRVMN
jgi:hypothetical protein